MARSDQLKRGRAALAAKHGQLVAQDKDLGVLGGRILATDAKYFKDLPDE
jgi:hypothetical protein